MGSVPVHRFSSAARWSAQAQGHLWTAGPAPHGSSEVAFLWALRVALHECQAQPSWHPKPQGRASWKEAEDVPTLATTAALGESRARLPHSPTCILLGGV